VSEADLPPERQGLPPVPPPGGAPPSPPPRHGCLTALMFVIGIVLLLPGLCAVIFGVLSIGPHADAGFAPLILIGLLIGFGGIMVIRSAIRGPQP
jgi:hypothetical protein